MVQSRLGSESHQVKKQISPTKQSPLVTGQLIDTLERTGQFLARHGRGEQSGDVPGTHEERLLYTKLEEIIRTEHLRNAWFTEENVRTALQAIAMSLKRENLERWISKYPELSHGDRKTKDIGVVMAGNIPLVGFHDLLCVLVSGHRIVAKTSSKDERLMGMVADIITYLDPELGGRITLTDAKLKGMDAVIATGSNNSARYFEFYFRDLPHIIRKNRSGIAVLSGNESPDELNALGKDIFTYFGLGCRNVTKIYVPEGYDVTRLMEAFDAYLRLIEHHKYANNIAYYRTIYLMSREPFLDNGVLLLKQSTDISSPVGVVYYENYSELDSLTGLLNVRSEEIQCTVDGGKRIPGAVLPGTTQFPELWDYADGVDTLQFLTNLDK